MLEIISSKFITSIATEDKINSFNLPEIAFAGRSNVGKSSCINYICNNNKLAKISSTCGKTKFLNYFEINKNEFYLVDLPGYGFAKVTDQEKQKWAKLINSYLLKSKNLKHVFVLVDIRHKPNQNDIILVNFLHFNQISFSIIATKSDKISKEKQKKQKLEIANTLNVGRDDVIIISTLKKEGKIGILNKIEEILNNENICN